MAKGVLGNDPFRRTAAPRAETAAKAPEPAQTPAVEPAKAAATSTSAAKVERPLRKSGGKSEGSPAKTESSAKKRKAAETSSVDERTRPSRARAKAAPVDADASSSGSTPTSPETQAVESRESEAPRTRSESEEAPLVSEILPSGEAANDAPFREEPRLGMEPEPTAAPVDVPLPARALGAMALARDILVQALDRPGLKRIADLLEGLMLAIRTGLGITGGGNALDAFGKDPALLSRLEPLIDFLYERYWRVTVENAAAIPAGPAILVANHAGALPLDGPVLSLAISRERPDLHEARWLVEDQIFYAPFWGALLNRLGAIRASPENALRLLEERRPVLVFPEGVQGTGKGFRERYQLKRFGRGGFVKLALRTGAPIIPVAIVGAEETTPMLAKLPGKALGLPYVPLTTPVPLPVRWAIRFGTPLHLKPEGDELAYVQQVTERTRSEIEAMLQSLLRERSR